VAPTVIALGALAGEKPQASALLLPAAMAYTTPAVMEFSTALLSAVEKPPPRLMLAAAGRCLLAVTQSMPAITPVVVPEPWQFNTRTATSCTFFATP